MRSKAIWGAGAGLLFAAAVAAMAAAGVLPRGIPGQWQWPTWPAAVVGPLAVAGMGAAIVAAAAAAYFAGYGRRRAAGWAAAAALAGIAALPYLLLWSEPGGRVRATLAAWSDLSFGYLSLAAREDDIARFVRDARGRTDLGRVPMRVATHPPGPVLFMRACLGLWRWWPGLRERVSSWLAGRVPLEALSEIARELSSAHPGPGEIGAGLLAALLLMAGTGAAAGGIAFCAWVFFGRGGEVDWRVAAVAGALVPALFIFNPSLEPWAAAAGIWAVALWALALQRRSPWLAFGAGAVWSVGLLWVYNLLALVVIFAALARRRWDWRLAGALAAGLAAGHLPLIAVGYNPAASLILSLRAHHAIMAQRSALPWMALNAWDFVLFCGLGPLALAAMARRRSWAGRAAIGAAAAVGLLLLSGSTRGEVGRIWSFLMPYFALAAGGVICELRRSELFAAAAMYAAGQMALALVLWAHLQLVMP